MAHEAARLLDATGERVSLFEFGTSAVAREIQLRAELHENPIEILRFIRSLAQESYENQRLSYGLIFSADYEGQDAFADAFDNKRAKRLTDGFSTALLLDADLRISGYAALNMPDGESSRLPRRPWWCAGLATRSHALHGIGVALVRSGDMLVLPESSFRARDLRVDGTIRTASSNRPLMRRKPICNANPNLSAGWRRASILTRSVMLNVKNA